MYRGMFLCWFRLKCFEKMVYISFGIGSDAQKRKVQLSSAGLSDFHIYRPFESTTVIAHNMSLTHLSV